MVRIPPWMTLRGRRIISNFIAYGLSAPGAAWLLMYAAVYTRDTEAWDNWRHSRFQFTVVAIWLFFVIAQPIVCSIGLSIATDLYINRIQKTLWPVVLDCLFFVAFLAHGVVLWLYR
jgi:hypothetical protein